MFERVRSTYRFRAGAGPGAECAARSTLASAAFPAET